MFLMLATAHRRLQPCLLFFLFCSKVPQRYSFCNIYGHRYSMVSTTADAVAICPFAIFCFRSGPKSHSLTNSIK